MTEVSVSDWVLIGSTLFLGLIAILTPTIGDAIKLLWFRPKLQIQYAHHPPGTHKTRIQVPWGLGGLHLSDTYYFRFSVRNVGRTQAHRCEALIEELWHQNSEGGLERLQTFGRIALEWGSGYQAFCRNQPLPLILL